jgi:hypothetical protein
MGKVVDFPSNSVAESTLRNSLEGQCRQLDDLYETLDALHSQMHKLEKDCSQLEYEYDLNLSKYATKVGAENVEVVFMGYTSRHIISVDAEGENFSLTLDPEVLSED